MTDLVSLTPYILRALHEWILDSHMTPHLLVNTDKEETNVPQNLINEGKVVLSLSPNSIVDLNIENEYITFGCRFSGAHTNISVPISSVMSLYAKETGQGMIFNTEEHESNPPDDSPNNNTPRKKPSLKIVR